MFASGKTFSTTINLFNPTIRFFNAAGTEITGTLPVEVSIYTPVTAKAFAGSSGPVIPSAGWATSPAWSTGTTNASVTTATTNPDGSRVDIRGVTVGSSSLTVQMLGITKTVPVDVRAKTPVASVTVTGPASLKQDSTGNYTAVPKDASGNVLSGRTVTWSVDNTAIATVTTAGKVTAVAPGSTNVRATIDGTAGTAPLTVTARPGVNLSVTYPGGVPTLSWTTTFTGTHDVYLLIEEEIHDVEFGDSENIYWVHLGSTSGTTFQDTGHTYTGGSTCTEGINWPYSYRDVITNYVVVPAASPSTPSTWLRADVNTGPPCYTP